MFEKLFTALTLTILLKLVAAAHTSTPLTTASLQNPQFLISWVKSTITR